VSDDALKSALRKLIGYANGSYHTEYIYLTQTEAQVLLKVLEKTVTEPKEHK